MPNQALIHWFCMNWLSWFLSDVWKQTHVAGPFDAARTIQNLKQSASMNRDGRISPSFGSPSFADPNSELIAWVSSGEPQLFKLVLVSPTSFLSSSANPLFQVSIIPSLTALAVETHRHSAVNWSARHEGMGSSSWKTNDPRQKLVRCYCRHSS